MTPSIADGASSASLGFEADVARAASQPGFSRDDYSADPAAVPAQAPLGSSRATMLVRFAARERAQALLAAQRQAARRAAAAARRAAASPAGSAGDSGTPAAALGSPQHIAVAMLGSFGWSSSEFGCLNSLWTRESGWNPDAENPYSGAYGIPQALPGAKMASAGSDWQTNAATQIKWGLGYIQAVYGSPCGAWSHELSYGSY